MCSHRHWLPLAAPPQRASGLVGSLWALRYQKWGSLNSPTGVQIQGWQNPPLWLMGLSSPAKWGSLPRVIQKPCAFSNGAMFPRLWEHNGIMSSTDQKLLGTLVFAWKQLAVLDVHPFLCQKHLGACRRIFTTAHVVFLGEFWTGNSSSSYLTSKHKTFRSINSALYLILVIWVWVKIRYPNNWMVNTKLD